jgi:hypothetical protein
MKLLDGLILFFVTLLVSYLVDKNNFLFASSPFNLYFYLFLITALYYGFFVSLSLLGIYVVLEYFYAKIDLEIIANYLITIFIANEFHYYWNFQLEKEQEKNKNLTHRIKEIAKAYYLTKLSHDELEKSYILKPFSIREVLNNLRKMANKEDVYSEFVEFLANLFNIKEGVLEIEDRKIFVNNKFNYSIKEVDAIRLYESSEIVAQIPIFNLEDKRVGRFLIKEIPFFSLNEENLLLISMFLNYFYNTLQKEKKYAKYSLNTSLLAEIDRLIFLKRKYDIDSYIVVFKLNPFEMLRLREKLRGSDIVFECGNKLIVVLPFMSLSGVIKFIDRLNIKEEKIIPINKSLKEIADEINNL